MSKIKKRRHCGLDPQSPEKRHRHSEQSEESVANFRGLPRRSYLTARNDGADWKTTLAKNLVNPKNLTKIVVQTKKTIKII